ncbi:MAG: hypothetical protein J6R04_06185 [Clostridia bacterium]|nr:hypothetical protein [Clostridia bacterium]
MEKQIIENLEKLYRSHIVTALLYFALIVIVVLVVVGVIRFKLLNARWKNILLISLVVVVSIGLIAVQTVAICPVHKDHEQRAYIVIEDAKVIIKDGSTGGLDSTNRVIVCDGETEIELKMQTDYGLDTEVEYKGKIAYLKYSNYLIWYELDQN